ncbi:MAG: hypothetical protein DI534_07285 [Leifsonia xyli]|nr:MAG: hypothetical protein DI534_07285 [Leifsonia xyli]
MRAAVDQGRLIRVRAGAFCPPDADPAVLAAARERGRLCCVSELRRLGVFVMEHAELHIHVVPTAARLSETRAARRHRRHLIREPDPDALCVEPIDAVRDAVICQQPRAAIATIDSALHEGVLRLDELDELFSSLPRRFRRLRRLLDHRAESGPESLMRIILRSLGCRVEVQVQIEGVGRVDFLVDGWLIVECDSEAHHSSWRAQKRDRRRDLAAAERGYASFRPIAEDIMWHADQVRAAIQGLLATRRARRA